jgi:hypothetical protein
VQDHRSASSQIKRDAIFKAARITQLSQLANTPLLRSAPIITFATPQLASIRQAAILNRAAATAPERPKRVANPHRTIHTIGSYQRSAIGLIEYQWCTAR